MSTFKSNFTINQGATFSRLATWKTGRPAVPADLTGCTARMQARATVDSPTVLLECTTENGGIVLGGAAGTIEYCRLTAVQSAAITWPRAVYDLEIIFPNGDVLRKIAGVITISPEVTRA